MAGSSCGGVDNGGVVILFVMRSSSASQGVIIRRDATSFGDSVDLVIITGDSNMTRRKKAVLERVEGDRQELVN